MNKIDDMNNRMEEQFSRYKGNADLLLPSDKKDSDDPTRWKELLCDSCYNNIYSRIQQTLDCKNPFKKKLMQMKMAKEVSTMDIFCDSCIASILKKTKEVDRNA